MTKQKLAKKGLSRLASSIKFVVFDFDGVFTDNRVLVSEDGRESVWCWRSDGFGLARLKKLGVPLLVISTEVNPVVSARCAKLGIPCVRGVKDKLKVLKQAAKSHRIDLRHTAYIGNDINDEACLGAAGFSAVVKDAHPSVLREAHFVTRAPGGYGAVREFSDLIAEALESAQKKGKHGR